MEYANTFLMSVWAMAMVAARNAVAQPTMAITQGSQSAEAARIGLTRTSRYTPAVTMVAAWIRADTGVGPAMASGSQMNNGIWADLPMAPMKSSTAMNVAVVWARPGDSGRNSAYFTVPKVKKVRKIATMKPQSPMRLVMKAFLPALALASFSNQKAMRK